MCVGVYIPVKTDEHWVRRMWTYADITKSKVRIRNHMLFSVVYCAHFSLVTFINFLIFHKKAVKLTYV